jgi:hypothetical protein
MKNIVDYLKVFKNIETYKSPGPRNMAQGGRIGFKQGKDVMPVRMTVAELHDFLGLKRSKSKNPFSKIYRNLDSDAYLALNPGKVTKDATGTQWRFDKPTPAQVEEIMKIHVGSGGAQSGKIRKATANAVKKLYKDKTFMNFLEKYKKGDKIPTQVIRKIFSADGAYSPHIASTLGRILEGQLELEGIKVNKKLGAKIQQGMEYSTKGAGIRGAWHTEAYTYARNQLNSLDPSKSFKSYQNDITKLLKELGLPNMSVDEIQAIRTGQTGGTNPWSVFSQILTDKENKFKGSRFDSETAKKQIELNNAIKKHGKNSPEVKNIITKQDEFVESFKNQNPEFKKKNLTRFDLRSPKQVLGAKVYNELPSGISDALDADFAKNKYSINVGEGALTQRQLIDKLEPITKLDDKQQIKLLKQMGYRCAKAGGGGETVACYMDDAKKTRADLKSQDVTVRAKALTKQRKALQVASKLPQIGKIVRQALQTGAAGVSTAFKWTGLGAPIGYAIEGAIEGGIYDYYRKQGYNHNQAFAETFSPRLIKEGLEGKSTEDVPWYGGAEKLREKELYGVREAPTILEDGTIVEGDLIPGKVQPKVKRYVDALEEQDRIYSAIGAKEQAKEEAALAETGFDATLLPGDLDAASADVQDLARSGAYGRVDRTLNPESMASQAYNIAVERQRALDERRKKEYMDKYYNVKEPSSFMQKKKQRDRYKEMNELFPNYSNKEIDNILAFYGEEKPDSLTYDQVSDIFKDQDKTIYFADNFRMEKAGGGMAGIRRPSAIPPESGPMSQGLRSLYNNGRKL